VLEVLYRVGDEDVAARNAGLLQRGIENRPRWADKRMSGQILPVARLLPDQHQVSPCRPLARNHLGGESIQRAARAFGFGRAKGAERLDRQVGSVIALNRHSLVQFSLAARTSTQNLSSLRGVA
jgi:hypothetical protein